MKTLNIIGAGRVGKSLGRLFVRHQQFKVQQIYNTTPNANTEACEFIGQGEGIHQLENLEFADVTLLAVPDDKILTVFQFLLSHNLLQENSVIFQCSGSKSSHELALLSAGKHKFASVHPVLSFADPVTSERDFPGTICSVEGDESALSILIPIFTTIGAKIVLINAENKILYHAASVFASNYLVSLMEVAIKAYCASGVNDDIAIAMAKSLASKTLENVFNVGTSCALTGPIKRGDFKMVERQLEFVKKWDLAAGALYEAFIKPTLDLASKNTVHSEK
jgi:predicted short-subunit dehydrogenase-like oxidoreductase (DUF2520 family)